jgi:hypothetical protein
MDQEGVDAASLKMRLGATDVEAQVRELLMRGVVMHAPGDVRVEERADPTIIEPTDAIIRLAATCICGSDLWPYRGVEAADHQVMGHEYAGVVEEVGSQVKNVKAGDFVVGSFVISDNTCEICRSGYQSCCVHGTFVAQEIGTRPPAQPRPAPSLRHSGKQVIKPRRVALQRARRRRTRPTCRHHAPHSSVMPLPVIER